LEEEDAKSINVVDLVHASPDLNNSKMGMLSRISSISPITHMAFFHQQSGYKASLVNGTQDDDATGIVIAVEANLQ
jgi:hypothetical protein